MVDSLSFRVVILFTETQLKALSIKESVFTKPKRTPSVATNTATSSSKGFPIHHIQGFRIRKAFTLQGNFGGFVGIRIQCLHIHDETGKL